MFFLNLDINSALNVSSSLSPSTQLQMSSMRVALVKYRAWISGSKTRVCGWYTKGLAAERRNRPVDHETGLKNPDTVTVLLKAVAILNFDRAGRVED